MEFFNIKGNATNFAMKIKEAIAVFSWIFPT